MVNPSLIVFALALFARCDETLALPAGRMEEDRTGQNSLSSVLGEDVMNAVGTGALSRLPLIAGRLADEDGMKRIFILSDLGSKGAARSEPSSTLGRAFPFLSPLRTDRAPAGTLKAERRDADDLNSMARRDLDSTLLRCMIGRVYRPCWQA
ncbi:pro-MCH [Pygocentrus nattereri]|uniref:pro-MCH n=1 Tax=Pygocentrus nattereri TaxID=42514 RepID=UPI00081443C2|nr:pro-MCH [Pygocentrus nattereri]